MCSQLSKTVILILLQDQFPSKWVKMLYFSFQMHCWFFFKLTFPLNFKTLRGYGKRRKGGMWKVVLGNYLDDVIFPEKKFSFPWVIIKNSLLNKKLLKWYPIKEVTYKKTKFLNFHYWELHKHHDFCRFL